MEKDFIYKSKTYKVFFVEKTKIAPFFGVAYKNGYVEVRNDLNPLVKRFVIKHELYHLGDETKNVFVRELKANFIPGLKDPMGFISCVITTIFSKERLKLYLDRIIKKY